MCILLLLLTFLRGWEVAEEKVLLMISFKLNNTRRAEAFVSSRNSKEAFRVFVNGKESFATV